MRILAILATMALVFAGCTAPEAEPVGETAMAPATTSHFLLQLTASGDPEAIGIEVADADGLDVRLPDGLHTNATGAAGWIGLEAPGGASGTHEVLLDVTGATHERVSISVEVAEGDGLGEGATAEVDLVLRTGNGTIALNTRGDVANAPLPRTPDYQPPPEHAPQPLALSSQQLGPEILGPLAGLAVGHSVTVSLEDYFGPEIQEAEEPRDETLDREFEMQRFQSLSRQAAEQEGLIDGSTQEGDAIEAGLFTYIVETLNDTTLRVELDIDEGDRVTLHDRWPEATVAASRDATTVVLRTDPPVEEGEMFTWRSEWPDSTEVTQVNGTAIVLRHTPEVGLTYETATQAGPAQSEVISVSEDTIIVEQGNPHPLAGQTMYLEATLVGEAAAQAGIAPQP